MRNVTHSIIIRPLVSLVIYAVTLLHILFQLVLPLFVVPFKRNMQSFSYGLAFLSLRHIGPPPFYVPPCPAISQSGRARAPPCLMAPMPLKSAKKHVRRACKYS